MLQDFLVKNLDLVICGTAVGKTSASRKQYYAGRGNCFWKTLAMIKLTPHELKPSEYKLLLDFGIGLTDIVKGQAGNDRDITFKKDSVEILRWKIDDYKPHYLCFNGKKAAKMFFKSPNVEYGIQQQSFGQTLLFVAPSTSASGRGYWNLGFWEDLASRLRQHD